MAVFARRVAPALLLLLVGLSCQPAVVGEPLLEISARPPEINDQGEETTIRVVATDGQGKVGKGQVTLTSEAGSLKDGPSFDLDAYGVVTAKFSCAASDDPYCKDVVNVTAKWVTDGQRASASTRVTILPPPLPPWENDVVWDANASVVSCSGVGPPNAVPCVDNMCAHGFTCIDGACLLNGFSGGLQYTLRFGQSVDLDLHVVEPVANGVCEVYWQQKNKPGNLSQCGAVSSLDLDSNAGCALDRVNIENIIFPNTTPRPAPGTYIARVDLYAACMATTPIKWELQVRVGRISRYYCGQFDPSDADSGGQMSGLTISTITIP